MKTLYKLKYRRRRAGRTDYRKRLKLLLSKKPRLVVRISLGNVRVQLVNYTAQGDAVMSSAFSQELSKFGWQYSEDSIPAAYLTGLLCGVRAKSNNINEAVLDIGLRTPVKGSRVYAALKGAIDSGVQINANPEIFPKEERIKGMHIANYASHLNKTNPSLYKTRFSVYLAKNASPEKITAEFENVKAKIISGNAATKTKKELKQS